MKKDIKTIISEAFNELYTEFLNEDASVLAKNLSPKEIQIANDLIQKSKTRGGQGGLSYNFQPGDVSRQRIFNYVVDALIDDYKLTRNPKSKEAIQSALYPASGSKMFNIIAWPGKGEDMEDAAASAYEQTLINNFDDDVNSYKTGTGGFTALVLNNLKARVKNYFMGYSGSGTGGEDAIGMGGAKSIDTPLSGSGGEEGSERTLKDKMGDKFGDLDPAISGFASDELEEQKQILDVVYGWLKNNVSNRQYIAFKELTQGSTPREIVEEYPDLFQDIKAPSRLFAQLQASPQAQEISDLVSHAFKINWNLADINPKNLGQTSSMNPEFGDTFSKRSRVSTPEMEVAQENLNKIMNNLGFVNSDFASDSKMNKILNTFDTEGLDSQAEEIRNALDALAAATEKAKQTKGYDSNVPVLPSSEEEERQADELGGMFEGIDLDALMERVLKRIS